MSLGIEHGPLAQAIGWALFHSVWQLLVVAALLWGTLVLLRNATALTRYWVSVAALACGALLPALTAVGVLAQVGEATTSGAGFAALPWVGWLPAASASGSAAGELAAGAAWAARIGAVLPALTLAWLAAVTLLSTRLLLGWKSVQRLRSQRTRRLPSQLTRRFYRVARGLGVRGVRFLESRAVEVPMVVGWLSPVVLIPAAALLRLAPHELESVVAHELAHVQRRDYLVNLVQTVLETVFFFHPAVWWISSRIREERECCCDDLAVSTCGDPLAYARALTELESLRAGLPRLALGATGGVLLERVRRLVRPECRRSANTRRDVGGLVVLLSAAVLLGGTGLTMGAPSSEELPPEPAPATRRIAVVAVLDDLSADAGDHASLFARARFEFHIEESDPTSGGPAASLAARGIRGEFLAEQVFGASAPQILRRSLGGDPDAAWSAVVHSLRGLDPAAHGMQAVVIVQEGSEHPPFESEDVWTADFTTEFASYATLPLGPALRVELAGLIEDSSLEGREPHQMFVLRAEHPERVLDTAELLDAR